MMISDIYRFKVGRFDCAIVNDGTYTYHGPAPLFFENAPRAELAAALKAHAIDLDTWTEYVSPYLSLVVNTGDHLVLVDTGMGSRVPTTGRLAATLQVAGYRLEDFDYVILTHAHPDHVGGNTDATGNLTYRNARHVLWEKEWRFWTHAPNLSGLRDKRFAPMMLDTAAVYLPPIQPQLMLVEPEAEIVPGVSVIAADGHTPGQMAVVVTSMGETVLAMADAVIHPVHLERPEWVAGVDILVEPTVTTRRRLAALATQDRMLVFAPHFSWPSLGHVTPLANNWQWTPLTEAELAS
jgi:glyoxylase-like metal-dependent hydrolase (beta-lactamase superfamily II)